jgi:hypothetical protein
VLIPAINLVNGRTVVRDLAEDTVEYFHIELDEQGIVLADGAPAETYVNHANRMMFANWPEYVALYGSDAPRLAADGSFARIYPCVTTGPQYDAIMARLDRQAGPLRQAM